MKTKMIVVVAAAAFGCAAICRNSPAQTNDPLGTVKELYNYSTWAGQTKEHYEQTVTNWMPDLCSMGITNFTVQYQGDWTNSRKLSIVELHPPDASAASVKLFIFECLDVTNAELALLSQLITAAPFPSFALGSSVGLDLGDRCYVLWGAVGERVVLVRNNICVSLQTHEYSVLRLAEELDCDLLVRSFSGPVLLQPGISDGAFHAKVPTVSGKLYSLEFSDSPAGTNWTDSSTALSGDGTIGLVTWPAWSNQQFFRLRVQ